MRANKELSFISGRDIRPLKDFDASQFEGLSKLGINISRHAVKQMMAGKAAMDSMAMDSLQPTVTTASTGTPVQFLQN